MSELTLIANKIAPIGSGVDSLQSVENSSQEKLSLAWIDTCSRNCYGVGH